MKYLWIIEKTSSKFIYYYNYSEKDLDGYLVSGLLAAMNTFSEAEMGDKGIESIEMGGMRWVYSSYPKLSLMLVAAGEKSDNANLMRARLEIICKMFAAEFEITAESVKNNALELSQFNNFDKTLETLQAQWDAAEEVMNVGALFDLLGIYQNIFIKLIHIIEENITGPKLITALEEIQTVSPTLEANNPMKDSFRLIQLFIPRVDMQNHRIVFDKAVGTNVMGLNPMGLDAQGLKSMFFIVLIGYKNVIASKIGEPAWLMHFNNDIRPYLFSKWEELDKMGMIKEILEIFLESSQ